MALNLADIGLKEYYCSALYNILLQGSNGEMKGEQEGQTESQPSLVKLVKLKSYASFGTPAEYHQYCRNGPQIKSPADEMIWNM